MKWRFVLDVLDDREKKSFSSVSSGRWQAKTLEEVGKKFGVTQAHSAVAEHRALELRRALSKTERPVDVELPVEAVAL